MVVLADRVEPPGIETRPILIELAGVHKVYRTGKLEYPALRGVDRGPRAGRRARARFATGGPREPEQKLHNRRLPCAVAANEPHQMRLPCMFRG
jgi:hypothetical protein